MGLKNVLTVSALASAMFSTMVMADNVAPSNAMTADQKVAIEKVVHDYLVHNPDVLLEASQALQEKQQVAQQKEAKSAILENSNQLLNETLAVAGNPKGSVTIVEFFDYQCGHCKHMEPVIASLIEKDPNLRVVYKEFPIFGKSSELGSKAALAAAMQGKYLPMQTGLFKVEGHLDEKTVMDVAKAAGLDVAKLKTDMESQKVKDALNANRQLAEKMHLMGTPAFIVLSTAGGTAKADQEPGFIPGAASAEALHALIQKAAS